MPGSLASRVAALSCILCDDTNTMSFSFTTLLSAKVFMSSKFGRPGFDTALAKILE